MREIEIEKAKSVAVVGRDERQSRTEVKKKVQVSNQ
jgi:hypothetical protein